MTRTPEHAIIYLFISNIDIYNRYTKYIDINYIKEYNKDLYFVFEQLRSFRKAHPDNANPSDFQTFVVSNLGADAKRRAVFDKVWECILASNVSEDMLVEYLQASRRKAILQKTAVAAFEAAEDPSKLSAFTALVAELPKADEAPDSADEIVFVTDDLEELYSGTVATPGLRWRLNSLNYSLGSLRQGDFGFIFARPETGKTTFLASEVSFMAGQAVAPVLWCNNEEQGEKVKIRVFQAALGLPLAELWGNREKNKAEYLKVTNGNVKVIDEAVLSKAFIERACEILSPALVVIDQIDKVHGFNADREDLRLGAIYQWARELAKRYCPVIAVCQADGTAEGKKWLTMDNVVSAKTSKQAEADWILGIGKVHDESYESIRHFHVSKNKLMGDPDSRPDMRHGKWDVIIEPEIARYKDVLS